MNNKKKGIYFIIILLLGTNLVQISNAENFNDSQNTNNEMVILTYNNPPYTPTTPSGPTIGSVGKSYTFSTYTTDPDGDSIYYKFFWHDGYSDWIGPYNSGQICYKSHSWETVGNYGVIVQAKDTSGSMSGWSNALNIKILENVPPDTPLRPDGPAIGNIGESITYLTSTIDPDGGNVKYGWDWNGDYVVDEWTNYYSSGQLCTTPHVWTSTGIYEIRVKAEDYGGEQSDFSSSKTVTISESKPPEIPTIEGPNTGRILKTYTYVTVTSDPTEDLIYYWIDWDDNTNSGWLGPYESEEECSVTKAWSSTGTYNIKVKAKDSYGQESDWSETLSVNIPKNKSLKYMLGESYNFKINQILTKIKHVLEI